MFAKDVLFKTDDDQHLSGAAGTKIYPLYSEEGEQKENIENNSDDGEDDNDSSLDISSIEEGSNDSPGN